MDKKQRIRGIIADARLTSYQDGKSGSPAFRIGNMDFENQINVLFPQGDDEGLVRLEVNPYDNPVDRESPEAGMYSKYETYEAGFDAGAKDQRDLTRQERLDRPELREIEFIVCSTINGDAENCNRDWCNKFCSFRLPRLEEVAISILALIPDEEEIRKSERERIIAYLDQANDTRDLDKRLQELKKGE